MDFVSSYLLAVDHDAVLLSHAVERYVDCLQIDIVQHRWGKKVHSLIEQVLPP